jgi:tRNA uridine 5-carboxymethylaminomethyl modification enzyme
LLRQDNADARLTEMSNEIGLASNERVSKMINKYSAAHDLMSFLKKTSVSTSEINPILETKNSAVVKQSGKIDKILSRPNIGFEDLMLLSSVKDYATSKGLNKEVIEQAEIQIKYSGYILKEKNNADKLNRLENVKIPSNFEYSKIKSMSIEARQKLTAIKPVNISQASRISGVSPNDISVLLVYMGR